MLQTKIENKTALVSVVGAGYVGLPMAMEIARSGYNVFVMDISKEKVDSINSGKSYILDVNSDELSEFVKQGKIKAGTQFDQEMDVFVICVPTLLNEVNDPDPKHILSAAENIVRSIKYGTESLIVLESTVYPGFTREVLLKALLNRDYDGCCVNYFNFEDKSILVYKHYLAFSPERIDPGNVTYGIKNTPKLVGGINKESTDMAHLFYSNVVSNAISVTSCEVAEMTKIYENIYRFVNINYANEMAILCEKMGIDIWEVINAAATKPFGFTKFTPSPGIGGACIPINPFYLKYRLRELGLKSKIIDVCEEINVDMPNHVVGLTADVLNKCKKSINGSKIIVFGVSYKPNIDDVRESPSLTVMDKLISLGAEVTYYDPYVDSIKLHCGFMNSVKKEIYERKEYDCAIIMTHHDCVSYPRLKS